MVFLRNVKLCTASIVYWCQYNFLLLLCSMCWLAQKLVLLRILFVKLYTASIEYVLVSIVNFIHLLCSMCWTGQELVLLHRVWSRLGKNFLRSVQDSIYGVLHDYHADAQSPSSYSMAGQNWHYICEPYPDFRFFLHFKLWQKENKTPFRSQWETVQRNGTKYSG